MIIREVLSSSPYDGHQRLCISIDGCVEFEVCDGDCEDNSLDRNFADCYDVLALLERVHDAGMRGEELVIQQTSEEWGEDIDEEDMDLC